MGKGKKRSKKKVNPKRLGSDCRAAAAPAAPLLPAGEAMGAAEDPPVANHDCINCDNCGVASPQKRCSQCLCGYYCSKKCQLQHWKHHKQGCALLKKNRDHYNAARDRNNLPGGMLAAIDGPCAICLEEEVKHPVTFECGHTFCFGCIHIYQCKENQPTCPYCRGEIPNVFENARDRYHLYGHRAAAAEEGSEERKRYCHLAMAECDAVSEISKHPESFLFFKGQIVALTKDPEELLKVSDKMLSEIQCKRLQLDDKEIVQTKLWRAQAYSEMGRWMNASNIYWELRKEVQLSSVWNEFRVEMGLCHCLFELGDYGKAIECGNRAVGMGKTHPGVHEYLALAQKAAGNIDAAKNTMSMAILLEEPWNVENLERNKRILRDL